MDDEADFVTTTPFLNVEKVTLSSNNEHCIVYDVSG